MWAHSNSYNVIIGYQICTFLGTLHWDHLYVVEKRYLPEYAGSSWLQTSRVALKKNVVKINYLDLSFQGPFVQLDELVHLLSTNQVSDDFSDSGGRTGKRKREVGEESDEEGTIGGAPPINDIYRSRQQKRVHNVA